MARKNWERLPGRVFRVAYAWNYLIQAIFSLLCPAGLLILGGWLLVNRCGWGSWVLIAAIVLGVLAGFAGMLRYLMTVPLDPTANKEASAYAAKSDHPGAGGGAAPGSDEQHSPGEP